AGIYLASRYGLTQSREQVPLTALYLGNEGKVELPGRGKMAEGNGWRLRNSRDSYTLTLRLPFFLQIMALGDFKISILLKKHMMKSRLRMK
ncbi:hypothetical protein NE476_31410, partial [Enterocloster bolteae]|nr:hypothetical protein [Enterocloster bolteae]